MRFEMDVEIGGGSLTDDECGSGELGRLLGVAQWAVLTGGLANAGDGMRLLDANADTVGTARLVPDWTVGEPVWVTTTQGSLLAAEIVSVSPTLGPQYHEVLTRFTASHELLTPVVVDYRGYDQVGRPVLARVRQS